MPHKAEMNEKAKAYRQILSNIYARYSGKCADELRSNSKHYPKSFWKILHKYSQGDKEPPELDLETFYEYFKNLNAGEESTEIDKMYTVCAITLFLMNY